LALHLKCWKMWFGEWNKNFGGLSHIAMYYGRQLRAVCKKTSVVLPPPCQSFCLNLLIGCIPTPLLSVVFLGCFDTHPFVDCFDILPSYWSYWHPLLSVVLTHTILLIVWHPILYGCLDTPPLVIGLPHLLAITHGGLTSRGIIKKTYIIYFSLYLHLKRTMTY